MRMPCWSNSQCSCQMSTVTIALGTNPTISNCILSSSSVLPHTLRPPLLIHQSTDTEISNLISHLYSFSNFSLRDNVKLQENQGFDTEDRCLETNLLYLMWFYPNSNDFLSLISLWCAFVKTTWVIYLKCFNKYKYWLFLFMPSFLLYYFPSL